MVSKKFIRALKTSGEPFYSTAHKANVSPGILYKITCGVDRPKQGDERVIRVGKVLGLSPGECFESELCEK